MGDVKTWTPPPLTHTHITHTYTNIYTHMNMHTGAADIRLGRCCGPSQWSKARAARLWGVSWKGQGGPESKRFPYIWCTYGNFSREITIHAVIYGVYIRFWPTLEKVDAASTLVHPRGSVSAAVVALASKPCAHASTVEFMMQVLICAAALASWISGTVSGKFLALFFLALRQSYLFHTSSTRQQNNCKLMSCIGLARAIYIRCIYSIICREITEYMVIYRPYITVHIHGSGQIYSSLIAH